VVRPVVDRVFSLSDVEQAFARLDSGAQFGKVVVRATA
jgi:NADPH:quinone reductase-like Zn-dependent oxidoreductase